ncbi:hypothetical protein [Parasitella parasitica]|uniref:Uncharacterized protein n=1 Tax=Parasitella parasitica TaxID=35722 RepID=A0A0B7MXE8_9FUNG|nr:hypothetical protein [Parasitella parasitica]
MEEVSEPIQKSSMKPHSASPESNTARTAYSGSSRGALLAECSVVSSNSTNGVKYIHYDDLHSNKFIQLSK